MINLIRNFIPDYLLATAKSLFFLILRWRFLTPSSCYAMSLDDILHNRIILWKNVVIWRETCMNGNVIIWDYTYINSPWTRINAWTLSNITIGKFCSISWWVSIIAKNEHNLSKVTTNYRAYSNLEDLWKDVIIGNDVWIWANATILPWIEIWNWAVIGAGSVVTKNVEDYSIVAWNPAKHIRYRFDEITRKKITNSNWWKLDISDIRNIDINSL